MSSESVDVAVVGGGISGLYTAWRLSSGPNPPKVALLESSRRLGGRIDTVPLDGPSLGSSIELGAMRFFPFMALVKNLLDHFGLTTEVFPGCQNMRQLYLRGVQIALDENGLATNSPYRLKPDEPQSVFALINRVLDGAIPGTAALSARQWRDVTKNRFFKDHELWRWGLRNVAEELISNEAYEFVYDGLGLDSVLLRTNAAMGVRMLAVPLPDYLAGRVLRPVNGFGSLVERLENRLKPNPSCSIFKEHRLISASHGAGGIRLAFARPEGSLEITAGKVVLAMPKRALELIDLGDLCPSHSKDAEWRKLQDKLDRVESVPAFKLFVSYEEAWWQSFTGTSGAKNGWKNGFSVTDLPLRQIFFGVGQGGKPAGNERVLLATYADTDAALYWEGLAAVSDNQPRMGSNYEFEEVGAGNLLTAIERQLSTIMDIPDPLPKPLRVGFMNWAADPFGGAWHEWKPGVDLIAAIPAMRQPIDGLPIYLCGEAYSWFQAWIEGALMSAERMLQDHFELPWPCEWLPTDYDLGP